MISIGSWNLRNLSKKRPQAALESIAQIIQQFDLVAIQEVRDEIVIANLCAILNQIAPNLAPYKYSVSEPVGSALTSAKQTGKRKERYAFVWNLRVNLVSPPALLEADHVFVRAPFCGFFRANRFDFVLITIHVVWGKLSDRKLENANINEVLLKVFERCSASSNGERDVILCGDFNMAPELIVVRDWTPLFTSNSGIKTIVGDCHLYDQIWINKLYTTEFAAKADVIKFDKNFATKAEAVKTISDHRPVCAWFNTSTDDDECDRLDLSKINI